MKTRVVMCLSFLLLMNCGPKQEKESDPDEGVENSKSAHAEVKPVVSSVSGEKDVANSNQTKRAMFPVKVSLQEKDSAAFRLVSATHFNMSLEGCASGLSKDNITDADTTIYVYKFDTGCLVKLNQFEVNGTVWILSESDPFTTWQPGDSATFQDQESGTKTMKVVISGQLSDPVDEDDVVSYSFSQIAAGSDSQMGSDTVGIAHTLSVGGQEAPPFLLRSLSLVGMTSTGAGQFVFTLECESALTGSADTLACQEIDLDDITYKLVADTYDGQLDLESAGALFPDGEHTIATTDKLEPGSGGTTNGGFTTNIGASVLVGPAQMHNNPNMLLILQAGNASYKYYNIDISTVSYP